jgi:hypothetical protein
MKTYTTPVTKTTAGILKLAAFLLSVWFSTGCQKFLEEKSDKSVAVPSTLRDARALLDNYTIMNTFYSSIGSQSDDDYYLTDAFFNSMATENQNNYVWEKEAYNPSNYNLLYNIVLYANMALNTVENLPVTANNSVEHAQVKGAALFFRAYAFFSIAQFWAPPYNKSTAASQPGISLRLSPDPNAKSTRATVEQTYAQVVRDLKEAAALLPPSVTPVSRPSRAAAFGALARVYLSMREYPLAGLYADSCLQLYNTLMNYNSISQTASVPFSRFNPEVILQTQFGGYAMLAVANWKVDSLLYRSYTANDLRQKLFFTANGTGTYGFKGSYSAATSGSNFNGIATDEIYLIRAECRARNDDKDGAMADLNSLLLTRWKTGTFVAYTASDATDALGKVLVERRKELVGRGLRWIDLRRLNFEPALAKKLVRVVNGKTYELSPGDKRYTFYIPQNVIDFSGMSQNER